MRSRQFVAVIIVLCTHLFAVDRTSQLSDAKRHPGQVCHVPIPPPPPGVLIGALASSFTPLPLTPDSSLPTPRTTHPQYKHVPGKSFV